MGTKMPLGINIPKASLILITVAFGYVGIRAGFGFVTYARANDPDVSIGFVEVFAWVIAPLGLAVYSGHLLRRHGDRLRTVSRDPWLAFAALTWLVDIGSSVFLAFYFADDAAFHQVQYRGQLIGQEVVTLLASLSFGAAFTSVFAIARSVRGAAALGLFGLLIASAYLSEATSVWLGL
jgi:hypothetical protein